MGKLTTLFLLLLVVLIVITSCEENQIQPTDSIESVNLKASVSNMGSPVFKVYPTGVDDTENLMNAFENAFSAGNGVVEMAEGEFFINRMVIKDFHGKWIGAGKEKTVIHPVTEGLECDMFSAEFIEFRGGDFIIQNFTIDISIESPCKPYQWYTGTTESFVTAALHIKGNPEGDKFSNSIIKNVAFKGRYVDSGTFTPYNVDNLLFYNGGWDFDAFGGNHRVEKCHFETSESGIGALLLTDADIIIGGSIDKANMFHNHNAGIFLLDCGNVNAEISGNKLFQINVFGGIDLEQGVIPFQTEGSPGKSVFNITDNLVRTVKADGIIINDNIALNSPDFKSSFNISNNKIKIQNYNYVGIFGYAANNVIVKNNKVYGQAYSGIVFGLFEDPCSEWQIKYNSFSNLQTDTAPIYLGPFSQNCLVIGKFVDDLVLDEGVNNEILVAQNSSKKDNQTFYKRNNKKVNLFNERALILGSGH